MGLALNWMPSRKPNGLGSSIQDKEVMSEQSQNPGIQKDWRPGLILFRGSDYSGNLPVN